MKIPLNQLGQQLKKGLAPLYLLAGDEPLLQQEAQQAIYQCARQQGFDEHHKLTTNTGFDWQSLKNAWENGSLFSEKKIISLNIPNGKPGDKGGKMLRDYCQKPPADTLLVVITPKLDASSQKTRWCQAVSDLGIFIPIWPIERHQLPLWLQQRAKEKHLQLHPQALQCLAEHCEGNLLAAAQEIEKLSLLYPDTLITPDQIRHALTNHSRYNVFTCIDSTLQGDKQQTQRIMTSLAAEGCEPLMLLAMLARELRLLAKLGFAQQQGESLHVIFQQHRVWENRKSLLLKALKRHPTKKLWRLLAYCQQIDMTLKGAKPGNGWQQLTTLALKMAS